MPVELAVYGVARVPGSDAPNVVLKERGCERYLVIGVGPLEFAAIASASLGVAPPRPLTHGLLVSAVAACGARVTRAEIHALIDDVFHARLVLDVRGRHAALDARASDAIAVALRAGIAVFAAESVLERAGITAQPPPSRGEDRPAPGARIGEDQLGAFRDVIRGLDLDDLGGSGQPE